MSEYDEYGTQDHGYGAALEPLPAADAEEAEAAGALDTAFNNDDLDPAIADTLNYRTTVIDAPEYDDDDDDSHPLSPIPLGVTNASTVYASRGPVDIDSIGGDLGNIIRQTLVLNEGPERFVGDDFDDGVDNGVDDGIDDPEEDEDVDEEGVGATTLGGGRDDGYDDGYD